MNKKELTIVKQAYKILHKEIDQKSFRCKEYGIGCCQCAFTRFMEEFKSIIDLYLDDK